MGTGDELGGLDRVAANERHFLGGIRVRPADAPIVLRCECSLLVCEQRIELTHEQYEPLRSSAARYAIYPHDAHVDPGVDRVVERQPTHWVVERQSSLEVLDFFGAGSETLTSQLTSRVTDLRIAPPVSEDDPETSP